MKLNFKNGDFSGWGKFDNSVKKKKKKKNRQNENENEIKTNK